MREVTEADVYIGEVLAAHLSRGHGDEIRFDYAGLIGNWDLDGKSMSIYNPDGAVATNSRIRLGVRTRVTTNMIDRIIDNAATWPDRCDEIGFDDATPERLAEMLRSRLASLK